MFVLSNVIVCHIARATYVCLARSYDAVELVVYPGGCQTTQLYIDDGYSTGCNNNYFLHSIRDRFLRSHTCRVTPPTANNRRDGRAVRHDATRLLATHRQRA
jgi:hypothetical protein